MSGDRRMDASGRLRYHGREVRGQMPLEQNADLDIRLAVAELTSVREMLAVEMHCERDRRALRKAATAKAELASRLLDAAIDRLALPEPKVRL